MATTIRSDRREPVSAAELMANYRALKQRLNPEVPNFVRLPRAKPRTLPKPLVEAPEKAVVDAGALIGALQLDAAKAAEIVDMVSNLTGVSVKAIKGEERPARIVDARQKAIWAVKTLTHWSGPRVGRFFDRDHTTIHHAIRRLEDRASRDADLRGFMDAIVARAAI